MKSNHLKFLFSGIVFFCFVSCATFQSASSKNDYYNNYFTCKNIKNNLNKEYGKYLESHAKQRLFVSELNKKRKTARILLTGDSISALYRPNLLRQDFPKLDILNTGIGGDTTDLFYTRLKADVLKYKPKIIIVSIGGNDLLRNRCINKVIDNTKKIISFIQSQNSKIKIIFLSVPPVYKKRLNAIVLYYNLKLQYLIRKSKRTYYADLWEKLASEEKPELDVKYRIVYPFGKIDEVHFNRSGYSQVASILNKLVLKISRRN